jgi:ABC-type uncharacterized transport system auxiliary subunit
MNNSSFKRPWLMLALLPLVMLQACSGVLTSEQPARQYYLLQPLDVGAANTGQGPELALEVSAVPGLDTDRIQSLGPDARLQPFGNARWPDHVPEVLTSALQRSLESTGQFGAVRTAGHAPAGGWLLQLEVREFYGVQDEAGATPSVRVYLAGSISCGDQSHPLGLRDNQPVAARRLANVVAAHQAGLDGVTRQLIERIQQLCR